jgi:hypothetical protein
MRAPILKMNTTGVDFKLAVLLPLCIFAAVLAACEKSLSGNYFPLEAGRAWTYQITQGGISATVVHTSLSPETLNGRRVYPRTVSLQNTIMQTDYYVADDTGLFQYATKGNQDAEPVVMSNQPVIFGLPLEPGQTWEDTHTSRLLGAPVLIPVTVVITKRNARVAVPAGTFDNCIQISVAGSAVTAYGTLTVGEEYWLAPNTGIVKSLQNETVDNPSFPATSLTVVLLDQTRL